MAAIVMGRNRIDTSNPRTIERLKREGRGLGEGQAYVSWLKVQDVPSRGRSHRMQGGKTGNRVVHLMSYLELQHFYTLEWDRRVFDYHEQYPLALEATKEIAQRMGIKHPARNSRRVASGGEISIVRAPNVMTTDFLVLYKDGGKTYREAHCVKPSATLEGKRGERVREKLRLESTYWEEHGTKWRLVTDEPVNRDHGFAADSLVVIDRVLAANVEAIHGYYYLDHFSNLTMQDVERVNDCLLSEVQEGRSSLANVASLCDERFRLPPGGSLTIAKYLIARRIWPADFSRPFHPCQPLALLRT
jgi:hypothetical protein